MTMLKTMLLLVALAQSGPTQSHGLQNAVTHTISVDGGVLRYYVDVRGNDTNTCTSPFTDGGRKGPCLTLQATERKIPSVIKHPVVVFIEDGGYAGALFQERVFEPATASGAYLALVGPLRTYVPSSGSATGTATSATACAVGPPAVDPTFTDSTQTWTTDNLAGQLLETTGGTGSGQFIPIMSNTGTVLSLGGCFGVTPNGTTTYAIRTWGAQITSTVNFPANYISAGGNAVGLAVVGVGSSMRNNFDSAFYVDSLRISVTPTAGNTGVLISNSTVYMRRSRIESLQTSGIALSLEGSTRLNLVNSVVYANGGFALFDGQSSVPLGNKSTNIQSSLLQSPASGSFSVVGIGSPNMLFTSSFIRSTNSASAFIVRLQGLAVANNWQGVRVICTPGGSTVGLSVKNSNLGSTIPSSVVSFMFDSGAIRECATGIQVDGPMLNIHLDDSTFQATAGTTAVSVANNGTLMLDLNSVISGSYTTQVAVDAQTATFAQISATPHLLSTTTRASVLSTP